MENKDLSILLKKLKHYLPRLKEEYKILSLEIFGSYVKNRQKEDSDLDILVTFYTVPSMFTYIRLENELSQLLGVSVDLVMKDAMKPGIAKRVLDEVIPV